MEDNGYNPGENVTVAVIDTGVLFTHEALKSAIWTNKDEIAGNGIDDDRNGYVDDYFGVNVINPSKSVYDDNGHGTFVSGVIAGNGTVNPNFVGIDPKSKLIVIKALDGNGETGASTILNAMQWVYDNKDKYNIKIVCMSFGSVSIGRNDPLKLGAEMLWDSGIIVVSAAGNSGPTPETIRSPGSSSKIITVGALDDHREDNMPRYDLFSVADFSSRGPIFSTYKPDMITSGVNINGLNNNIKNGFFTKMSGTSVSTPMVAGMASIILKKYPKFTPDQVKKYLINCCTPITGDRNSEGFGWLDGRKIFRDN
jgi:serine protease AprX